jgi:hypothetical protein
MSVEQLLLTAISGLTSALLFVVRILWKRSEQCETDRVSLRQEIEDVKTVNGEYRGFNEAVRRCPVKDCSFADARPVRHTSKVSTWHGKPAPEGG